MCKAFSALVTLSVLTSLAAADDRQLAWPRFRGPNGSGIANQGEKPPIEFGPEKNLKWKTSVPAGLSSPIVAGELLVIAAFDGGKLYTIAYRRDTGKEAWRAEAPAKEIEKFHAIEGSPATSTPATDGQRIVSYFGSFGLIAYDLTGKELWKHGLPIPSLAGDFGSGVSPIIADGLVVLLRDEAKDARILALDAATGSPKWETKRRSPISYGTPVVYDTPAGTEIAAPGHARMIGYELKSGAEKWTAGGLPAGCCTSPVLAEGTLYFAGSTSGTDDGEQNRPTYDSFLKDLDKNGDGVITKDEGEDAFKGFFDNQDVNKDGKFTREEYDAINKLFAEGQNKAFALKPGGMGDVTDSNVLWKHGKGLPYLTCVIVYGGQCLMVRDGGVVTARDAKSGEQLFQARTEGGQYYASPVAADGKIYFTSLDGAVTVLKAGTAKPEVLVKNPKLGERTVATPAIADNTFYLRTEKHLYSFADLGR